jgi:hypothetical protein
MKLMVFSTVSKRNVQDFIEGLSPPAASARKQYRKLSGCIRMHVLMSDRVSSFLQAESSWRNDLSSRTSPHGVILEKARTLYNVTGRLIWA